MCDIYILALNDKNLPQVTPISPIFARLIIKINNFHLSKPKYADLTQGDQHI